MKKIAIILSILMISVLTFGESTSKLEYYIQNKKIGLRDIESKIMVVPCKYDFIGSFSNDLAPVQSDGKWGFINANGKVVIPIKYEEAKSFSYKDGLAPVKINGKWGFINKSGILKISCKYDEIEGFSDGLSKVKQDGKWGMIDIKGKIVIPFEYDEIKHSGLCSRIKKGEEWGAVGTDGKILFQPKYDKIEYPNSSLRYFPVELNGKKGYVDFYGNDTF